jgi:HTH-type transcriptional regulator/antitoxin HigA
MTAWAKGKSMATNTRHNIIRRKRGSQSARKSTAPVPGGTKIATPGKAGTASRPKRVRSVYADSTYLPLIRRFPLRPIRSDAELDEASRVVDELTDRDDLSPTELDYLDVLGDLIEKYEDEHVELPEVSDSVMLRSLMEENGVKQVDVIRGTGISKTVLSLILSGKRKLTRKHLSVLVKYFGVSPSSFLGAL